MSQDSTIDGPLTWEERRPRARAGSACLIICWCRGAPERVGEVLVLPRSGPALVGRGPAIADDPAPRLAPVRQRPGETRTRPPLETPTLSRVQLLVQASGGGLALENRGRARLVTQTGVRDQAHVEPGQVVLIERALVLLCARRPQTLAPLPDDAHVSLHAFGEPDPWGMVGESLASWQLRQRVGFVARRAGHVLVTGPSGTGKELVARAMHLASPRARRTLVSRSAATIPEGLVAAELFGNLRNYPNPGIPERAGLVGQADGGTLYLDEIGELPEAQQAALLRVLDSDGEYQRLGEARVRRSDLRLVAATNRGPSGLKHDFLARFPYRIQVPGLSERPEDVPLLAAHLLSQLATSDAELGQRFLDDQGRPRLSQALVAALVAHPWSLHVRELQVLLNAAMAGSTSGKVQLTEEVQALLRVPPPEESVRPESLSSAEIQACLDRHDGVRERVWRELGLKNRFQLGRLIKKHGLQTGREE